MTQTSNRLLDEFAKLMTDAAGVAQGARREAETFMRGQAEKFMSNMDLVTREEHDAVRAMAEKALEETEALKAEIAALKTSRSAKSTGTAKKTAKKSNPS